jgi:hypothetical protein
MSRRGWGVSWCPLFSTRSIARGRLQRVSGSAPHPQIQGQSTAWTREGVRTRGAYSWHNETLCTHRTSCSAHTLRSCSCSSPDLSLRYPLLDMHHSSGSIISDGLAPVPWMHRHSSDRTERWCSSILSRPSQYTPLLETLVLPAIPFRSLPPCGSQCGRRCRNQGVFRLSEA